MGPLYLLDTNILVHFVRGSRVWHRLQARYSLLMRDPSPVISIVTAGELRSLAERHGWGAVRRSQVNFILGYFEPQTIDDPSILEAYARIDTASRRAGHKMGKNDLWIAATARALGATILTTDHDFDHLAPAFVQLAWFDPTLPAGGTP